MKANKAPYDPVTVADIEAYLKLFSNIGTVEEFVDVIQEIDGVVLDDWASRQES